MSLTSDVREPRAPIKGHPPSPVLSYDGKHRHACARDPRQLDFPWAQPFFPQLTVQLLPALVHLITVRTQRADLQPLMILLPSAIVIFMLRVGQKDI